MEKAKRKVQNKKHKWQKVLNGKWYNWKWLYQ